MRLSGAYVHMLLWHFEYERLHFFYGRLDFLRRELAEQDAV